MKRVIASLAQGSAAALPVALDFREMVQRHQAMVFSLACHFLRDRALAEELAQEVFLQLHRHLPRLETPEHVGFWLRKVTSHRAIDFARRRRRQPQISLDDVPEPVATADPGDPMLSEKLRMLIASLPDTPRMVVILRYQEDLDPAEIAEVLDMPVRTVKSHLQRSLALLRQKLSRWVGEENV